MSVADGAVVGSYIKENGVWWEKISVERLNALMAIVHEVRKS
jgi:predicted TIM-barrel enzyme